MVVGWEGCRGELPQLGTLKWEMWLQILLWCPWPMLTLRDLSDFFSIPKEEEECLVWIRFQGTNQNVLLADGASRILKSANVGFVQVSLASFTQGNGAITWEGLHKEAGLEFSLWLLFSRSWGARCSSHRWRPIHLALCVFSFHESSMLRSSSACSLILSVS